MSIRVIVNGAFGKMGKITCEHIEQSADLELVAGLDHHDDLAAGIKAHQAQVVVDFTSAEVVFKNVTQIIQAGARAVVGTSGLKSEQIKVLAQQAQSNQLGVVIAPNFSIGAVLMMKYAADAVKYLPDAEIIESILDDLKNDDLKNIEGIRNLPSINVTPVPSTVEPSKIELAKRGKDIMAFGVLRLGKGLEHVITIAQSLKKNSDNPSLAGKKIHIVGAVPEHDPTFLKLMKAVYPQKIAELSGKTSDELKVLLSQYQTEEIHPALPIEFHIDVPDEKLLEIFAKCTYGLVLLDRGTTTRTTSIPAHCINLVTYSFVSAQTPKSLLPGGEYDGAIVFEADPNSEGFPQSVLDDIAMREQDPKLNDETLALSRKFVANTLSIEAVVAQHIQCYKSVVATHQSAPIAPGELSLLHSKLVTEQHTDEVPSPSPASSVLETSRS